MKSLSHVGEALAIWVAPVRERGLKSCGQCLGCRLDKGRSREGAWIEIPQVPSLLLSTASRSREGAWIEIAKAANRQAGIAVAPVRERGLK